MLSDKRIQQMLTVREVARHLNVSINTVRRWSNKGLLNSYRIGNRGDRRFNYIDVRNMLLEDIEVITS